MPSDAMAPGPAKALAGFLRRVLPARMRPIGYLTQLVRTSTHDRVRLGPFAGMRYIDHSIGSAYLPKLLGTYERELGMVIEEICSCRPGLIVDVGAAEGYYAVGLALRNPRARVVAFESQPVGRTALCKMAALNGVAAQVEIHGRCDSFQLETVLKLREPEASDAPDRVSGQLGRVADRLSSPEALLQGTSVSAICSENRSAVCHRRSSRAVVCDVEGDEECLLDPCAVPSLGTTHILVETHEFGHPGIIETLLKRFVGTHRIEQIWQENRSWREFPFRSLGTSVLPKSYLAWAVSEWRPERMCWLWMKPRG